MTKFHLVATVFNSLVNSRLHLSDLEKEIQDNDTHNDTGLIDVVRGTIDRISDAEDYCIDIYTRMKRGDES